jgi:4-hydroxy-3-methylbut-2-en-1-yl diphosphate reductase
MSRAEVRELPVSSAGLERGEVLVPTHVGDPVHGLLSCPAAPLVAGSLRARGRPVRLADLTGDAADTDGRLYLVTCPREDGGTAAVAAAAAPGDALSAAAARAVVEEWAGVCANRSLLLAGTPWCSGALYSASAAKQAAADHQGSGRRVRVLTPAATPPENLAALEELGAVVTDTLDGLEPGDVVVFPAHGVTAQLRAEAARRDLTVIDATCPIVAAAQAAAARAADRGHQLVLVGQPDQAATNPIISQALGRATVAETPGKTASVSTADGAPVSYLLQPGFSAEAGAPILSALRSRYPAARPAVPAEVCYAPSDRAGTIYSVALGSDLMLVVGDPRSSDARHACGLARDAGTKVQLIGAIEDIKPSMLSSVHTIGMAESTSAPADLAALVLDALSGLGRLTVARRRLSTEKATGVLG